MQTNRRLCPEQKITAWKPRSVGRLVFGCVILCFVSLSCGTSNVILTQPPSATLVVEGISSLLVENTTTSMATVTLSNSPTLEMTGTPSSTNTGPPTNTATETPSPQPTLASPTTSIPRSLCTKLRFAEYLDPDSVDEMINEGVLFRDVSEISVRFDCSTTTSNQITWKWRVNGNLHCTNTFQSKECDQSTLISWDRLPGKFLITLFSKDGYLGNLDSGDYELIIYISGSEALRGSIKISE
jgi:hypothetical protein